MSPRGIFNKTHLSLFYAVTARWLAWAGTLPSEHQHYWLPQHCLLSDDNMTVPTHAPPAACATQTSPDDASLQPRIYLPQLNHLSKVLKRGNDHEVNVGPNSRQTVRIPTQRVLTVLWVHHWQRFLSTKLQNIPVNSLSYQ